MRFSDAIFREFEYPLNQFKLPSYFKLLTVLLMCFSVLLVLVSVTALFSPSVCLDDIYLGLPAPLISCFIGATNSSQGDKNELLKLIKAAAELSSVAWSTGTQLIIFFCFRFSVVLFDGPGISTRHAAHCICRVLVFASS